MRLVRRKTKMLARVALAFWLLMLSTTAEIPLDYFDNLRNDPSLSITVVNSSANNVLTVTDAKGEEYRVAEFTSFIPLSDGTVVREGVENDAAAALLAIHHFNNIGLSPFLDKYELSQCNIKATMEIIDTELSPINATRKLTRVLQRNHTLGSPLPAGVIGAYRSAVTSPLAILTGVNNIPQISYSATSTDFDVKEQYPLFGRTVMSSIGEAQVAVEFFGKVLQATHVGVLFVTDSFGSALQKAFQDAASQMGIITDSVAFSYSADSNGLEIRNAVESLKSTQFNLFYVIAFESHYESIMKAAYDQGLIGADKLWIFDGFEPSFFTSKLRYPLDSDLARASAGVGLISISGGIRPEILYPDKIITTNVEHNLTTGYQRFRSAWRLAMASDEFKAYVRLKLPVSLNGLSSYSADWEFSQEPTLYGAFIYDAVTSLTLSYCRALAQFNNTNDFTGPSAFEFFRNLDQDGASGRLKIDNETGSRDYTTLTFTLFNVQPSASSDNETVMFNAVPTDAYSDGIWSTIENRQFVYSGGGTETPASLPDPVVNENFIGTTGQAVGYVLMGIVMAGCLGGLGWLIWLRRERVVRSSQPLFLFMICMGTAVMASSIVPLSFDETVVDESRLDTACMAAPWLYMSGSILAFSALVAKTRGVHQAFKNPELNFIHVTSFDLFWTFAILYGINLIVLIPWTLIAPLEWNRVPSDSTDIFDRAIESYGICNNEDSLPFVIVILIFNIATLFVANWWAYQARNIETEYHESRYIGISMASILQAWCMGIPILIVVWDNPQARFFVEAGIIFVTALAALLLIFLPKILSVRADHLKAVEENKRQAYNSFQARSRLTKVPSASLASKVAGIPGVASDTSPSSTDDAAGLACAETNIEKMEVDAPGYSGEDNSPVSKVTKQGRSFRQSLMGGVTDFRKSMNFSKSGLAIPGEDSMVCGFGLKIIHNPRASSKNIVQEQSSVRFRTVNAIEQGEHRSGLDDAEELVPLEELANDESVEEAAKQTTGDALRLSQ